MTCGPFLIFGFRRIQWRERAFQILPCTMQPRLYGSHFGIDGARDLCQRHFLVFGKDQHLALQRRQRADGHSNGLRNVSVIDAYRLRNELFVAELFPSIFVSPPLEREVASDTQKIRAKRSSKRIIAVSLAQQTEEHFLSDILCSRCGTGQPPGETIRYVSPPQRHAARSGEDCEAWGENGP